MSETTSRGGRAEPSEERRTIIDGGTMRTVVETVLAVVDECRIDLNDEDLHISAADPAAVAAVSVDLDASAFECYGFADGTIGVDLTRLDEILGMAGRGTPVGLALDPETRKLRIRIGELEYTMALIDPEAIRSPPDPAELDFAFDGSAVVAGAAIDRFVTATAMVSDHLAIGMEEADDEPAFYVEASGDTDDVSLTVPESDLGELSPGTARSLFSVDYLGDIERAIPGDARVRLRLGNDLPMEMRYDLADGAGRVEYLLSPRIART